MPARTDGKATAAKRRSAGIGTIWSVALRDDAQRALGPDEQLRQLGAHRVPRHLDRLDQAGGRSGHAQVEQQILDLAVAGGEYARAARRDVAADRRPLDRGGVVRQHQAAGVQLRLEASAVHPAWAVTVIEVSSISSTASSERRSSTMPP